ncbi:MAG: pimeloyl-ACP methyl ester carboxylesterase [Myxococcota bacterium]
MTQPDSDSDSAYAYVHGFGSSSLSRKGGMLRERFAALGQTLYLPDLNVPSFEQLTYTGALSALSALDEREGGNKQWRLIGSSMGSYISARWAELNPDRVDRLVLLCPAFDLMTRWPQMMGEVAFGLWQRKGAFFFAGPDGEPAPLHWGFVEDARLHPPYAEVPCATHIIHGLQDEIVPIESSRNYAAERFDIDLTEVDDGHDLAASHDVIFEVARAHFGISA